MVDMKLTDVIDIGAFFLTWSKLEKFDSNILQFLKGGSS